MRENKNPNIQTVAVIGAGAAGLVTARELSRLGFEVSIFEQSGQSGGLWVYQEDTETDALGQDLEQRIHTSLYDSLHTNLPRDLMAFSDYTFDSDGGGDNNWPRFPHHSQVRSYLDNFARDYQLLDKICFNTELISLEHNPSTSEKTIPTVTLHLRSGQQVSEQNFDAVAICTGHFVKPRVPTLAGMDIFSGKQLHSHNYRHPQQFKDQRVAIFGISASGADIAREIASQASQVYWCGDTFNNLSGNDVTDPNCENIHLFSCPTGADSKGRITFKQNRAQKIDTFIFATGYHYDFPFLKMDPCISVNDNYISPLYQQIISAMCPNIGFIGIPFLVIPFPFFEIQARWFSNVLKQNIALPTTSEMIAIVEAHEKELQKNERKKRLYHQLGTDQDAYLNALLFEMGESSVPEWVTNLMEECRQVRTEHPDSFRDETYINHGPSKLPY